MTPLRDVTLVIAGLLSAGYLVAALYFLKFYRQTRDRLFAFFAAAFILLVVQRLALALATDWVADSTWYYAVRLLAFALIAFAIIDKNREGRG